MNWVFDYRVTCACIKKKKNLTCPPGNGIFCYNIWLSCKTKFMISTCIINYICNEWGIIICNYLYQRKEKMTCNQLQVSFALLLKITSDLWLKLRHTTKPEITNKWSITLYTIKLCVKSHVTDQINRISSSILCWKFIHSVSVCFMKFMRHSDINERLQQTMSFMEKSTVSDVMVG